MLPESRFYRAVRQFAETAPIWRADRITYFSKPDERYDLTLVSLRVYGTRDEFLAVMAAAGLDRLDQELTEREIVLPSRERLESIKEQTQYRSSVPAPVR
jgi:hypothetical protein